MPLDPLTQLASVIHAGRGSYALVIGSGCSRGAGIPTGWDIALDLVRRVAVAEGIPAPEDPVAWYSEHHGEDPGYSQVLELLASSTGDRQALLDPYFEPSADDREAGLKQPTAAHRAIADLVGLGLIRVIVTTNFDRLLEAAFVEVGIEPYVVADAESAGLIPPIHTIRSVLIIKVNGDHLSPNLKNTLTELEELDDAMTQLLADVFAHYGVLVAGWSADWDPALRRLLVDHQPTIFATYWALRGDPTGGAATVMKARGAVPIPIEDADQFFSALASKVQAIADLNNPAPATPAIAAAEAKRFLADVRHRIRLHDLVMDAANTLIDETGAAVLPVTGRGLSLNEFFARTSEIEERTATVATVLATIGYHGNEHEHFELARVALDRLAQRPTEGSGLTDLIRLQHYPTLLALWSYGFGCLAGGHPQALARALSELHVREGLGAQEPLPIAYALGEPDGVVSYQLLEQSDDFRRFRAPRSEMFLRALRPFVAALEPDERRYEDLFDDVEFLVGIASFDYTYGIRESGWSWGYVGRYRYRRGRYVEHADWDAILDRHRDELLAGGLFGGSDERLDEMRENFNKFLASIRR